MPIVADAKDWTWVLERPCPECGLDTRTVSGPEVPQLLRQNASTWSQLLLARPTVGVRPSEDRWSDLEYACHVRDVFRIFDRRLHLMLQQDNPMFPNWDQDATAVSDSYNTQDPAAVAIELNDAATVLAGSFDSLDADCWNRRGSRSDGAHFTMETLARYLIHDPVHHLHDVGALARPRRGRR
jgi:hypothetical protein